MNFEEKLEKQILQSLPQEALITCAKFEGTNIALYTKNPEFSLTELTLHLISSIKIIKKEIYNKNRSKHTFNRGRIAFSNN